MANIPTQNNNPGDLKNPTTGQFQAYDNPEDGFSALKADLQGKITGNTKTGLTGNSTLQDFASVWAPDSDGNNSTQYAQKLASKLGVTTNTPIGSLSGRLDDFASAIADNEGYQGQRVLGSETSAPTIQPESPVAGQMSIADFASKIRAKYPQYQNLDDNTLTQKVLAKYPQYQNVIAGTQNQPAQSNTQNSQGYTTSVADVPSTTPSPNSQQSTYGKILNNPLSNILSSIGDAASFGGASQLGGQIGDSLATLYEKAQPLFGGKDYSQYVEQPNIGDTVAGTAKTLTGLASLLPLGALNTAVKGTTALASPELSDIIGMSAKDFQAFSPTEQMDILEQATKNATGTFNQGVIANAAKELAPAVQASLPGASFATRYPMLSGVLNVGGNILKNIAPWVGGAALGAEGGQLLGKIGKLLGL